MRGNALSALRHRRRRPRIAMLALAAFLFQALLLSFHAPVHSAVAGDLLTDLKVVCSATSAEDGVAVPADRDSDHHPSPLSSHCPICRLTQVAVSYLPVAGLELVLPEEPAEPFRLSLASIGTDQSRYPPQSPRAPPFRG